jgi:hypothetical protein
MEKFVRAETEFSRSDGLGSENYSRVLGSDDGDFEENSFFGI